MTAKILTGDCRLLLKTLPDASVDSIVTDPPYELGFMGKGWDSTGVANDVETWRQCLRVLKPGGHLLAFGGTRTQHRMVCAIEDAGFEIRDQIMWVYGAGFPKSLNVSKAIDKARGADPGKVLVPSRAGNAARRGEGEQGVTFGDSHGGFTDISEAVTDSGRQWAGWGTALKPAWEPICVARKPLIGTVAANVLAHGTGAINIDGCRVETDAPRPGITNAASAAGLTGVGGAVTYGAYAIRGSTRMRTEDTMRGRWPANLIHDGSPDVVALFPETSPSPATVTCPSHRRHDTGNWKRTSGDAGSEEVPGYADSGSAARFFYCAKASAHDRHEGLQHPGPRFKAGSTLRDAEKVNAAGNGNHHPTVKPTDLMRYLCRLVTPPGGTVLDPFMGSGSTLKAAELEGLSAIGIELDPAYVEIARRRIASDAPLFRPEGVTS